LWTLTPSSRTGLVPASVRSSNAIARAAISSGSHVGGVREWLRVIVVKSEYRTLMVTVRHVSPLRSSQAAPSRAMSSTS
jgi:hypothetical protein